MNNMLSTRLRSIGVLATQVFLGLFCLFNLVYFARKGAAEEFQRFGSLLVFFGVLYFFGARVRIEAWVYAERQGHASKREYAPLLWTNSFVELLFIALGTLIWGYGDLFVCWLQGHGWAVCYQ